MYSCMSVFCMHVYIARCYMHTSWSSGKWFSIRIVFKSVYETTHIYRCMYTYTDSCICTRIYIISCNFEVHHKPQ